MRMEREFWRLCAVMGLILAAVIGGLVIYYEKQDSRPANMQRFAKKIIRILQDSEKGGMAELSLQSTLEQGGTLIHYISASMEYSEGDPSLLTEGKPQPFSIMFVDKTLEGGDEVLLEGYYDDVNKPAFTERCKLKGIEKSARAPRRPAPAENTEENPEDQ